MSSKYEFQLKRKMCLYFYKKTEEMTRFKMQHFEDALFSKFQLRHNYANVLTVKYIDVSLCSTSNTIIGCIYISLSVINYLRFVTQEIVNKRPHNGTLAEAWRGGIGKYPPHPERLPMPNRCPEAKPTDKGGIGNLEG